MLRPAGLVGSLAVLGRASALGFWSYFDTKFGHADSSGNVRLNHTSHTGNMTFDSFIDLHGREYDKESEEYVMRGNLYKAHAEAVRKQNSDPNRLWQAKINHLADRTKEELASLRGYRRGAGAEGGARGAGGYQSSFLETDRHVLDVSKAPSDWSWVGRLKSMSNVRDQGECGSCWAFAVSTVLRAFSELYQQDRTFSVQQLLSCTPNPHHCGGDGGCMGATAELAMQYASKMSLFNEESLEYQGKDGGCPVDSQVKKPSFVSVLRDKMHNLGGGKASPQATSYGMTSWRKLPENKYSSLLMAVFEEGPVAISLSAGEFWNHYDTGVLDACEKGAIVNHAAVLVGYGEVKDKKVKYWQIQNSWGPTWGERGHVRLFRHDGAQEDQYCGWDEQPEQGTGCKGGPPKVWVCGSCGILYDSVVPTFAKRPEAESAKLSMQQSDEEDADDEVMDKAESMLQVETHSGPEVSGFDDGT